MKKWLLFLILTGMYGSLHSQPVLGDKAPQIRVDTWVKNPNTLFKEYKNKVVVVDFWFTQCAPCLYTMPHLNDLAEAYKEEDIVFMAITFENEERVADFLQKKKMLAMVGTDTSETMIRSYDVNAYPHTFIINKKGILVWEGYPANLSEELLDIILNKEFYPKLETTEPVKPSTTDMVQQDYKIELEVNDYMVSGSGMMSNSREISIQNKTIREAYAFLLNTSTKRIIVEDTVTRYDIRFKIPKDISPLKSRQIMAEKITNELGYAFEKRERVVKGYTLNVTKDSLFIKHAVDTTKKYQGKSISSFKSYWQCAGTGIEEFTTELENRYNIYVFNETMLNGYFEFSLPNNFDEAAKKLINHYGLTLVPSVKKTWVYQLTKPDKKE